MSTKAGLAVQRIPWLVFLFLATVFFLIYHDVSFSARGIGNYNLSEKDLISGIVQGSLVRRVAFLSLGVFAIVSFFRYRSSERMRIRGPLGWILLGFVAWAFVSPIWAENVPQTLTRLVGFGILCVAAVAVARRLSLREIIQWTFFSTTLFLVIGLFAELFLGNFRPFASGYRFSGTLHPNGEGIDCGLLVLSALAAADLERPRRKLYLASAFVGFLFLILTGSRTAFGAVVFALAAYATAVWSKRARMAAVYALGILFCVFLMVLVNASVPNLKSAALLGRDDAPANSFDGRTDVWEVVSRYVRQRPILGFGYGGFWTPTHMDEISTEEKWGVPDSHSAYLDYLLTLGAVGLAGYALLLAAGIRRAFRFRRLSRNSAYAFCGALLVFSASVGFLESAPAEPSLLMFLVLMILVQLAVCRRPEVTIAVNQRKAQT